jgi:hypothetical protein
VTAVTSTGAQPLSAKEAQRRTPRSPHTRTPWAVILRTRTSRPSIITLRHSLSFPSLEAVCPVEFGRRFCVILRLQYSANIDLSVMNQRCLRPDALGSSKCNTCINFKIDCPKDYDRRAPPNLRVSFDRLRFVTFPCAS